MVVVQCTPSTPAGSDDDDHALLVVASADARHPVRQKYLVARSREKKNSIFDYVQLSSSLLRKIRYGQSLDAVLVTRSPWGSAAIPSSPTGIQSLTERRLKTKSPLSPWGRAATLSSAPAVHRDGSKSVNQRGDANRMPHAGTIQYGHAIQLQATDGGFLAVDMDDGALCKLSKSHRDDPRTLLTLFPQDPLRPLASRPFVTTHELCFVALGAATISEHHQVLYADSREIIEPPAVLRDAVRRHCQDHGDSTTSECRRRRRLVDDVAAARAGTSPIVWSFRPPNVGGKSADFDGNELLETGALVQLAQGGHTLHYEMERIVKRKYTPLMPHGAGPESIDPEDADAPPPAAATATRTATAAPLSASTDAGDGPQQTPAFTHVWLQQNDHSSQQQRQHHHDSTNAAPRESPATKRRRWDNLWFIIDVTTDRRLEKERKQRVAELEAEEEAKVDAARDDQPEDSDDRNQRQHHRERQSRRRRQPSRVPAPSDDNSNGTDAGKRVSVVHARVFVGQAASESQRHAAAIIVKFLRHVSRREAERRAKYLIDRRIRRTGKHRECEDVQLSTTQQLRVLQCFNPTVYGSQRLQEPPASPSRRIAGISLQGSKFPKQESNRLVSMARDLRYLGSKDFQQQQHEKHVLLRTTKQLGRTHTTVDRGQLDQISLRAKQHQNIARERERSQKLHVQLAMAHREKPPFHFGKPLPLPHSPVRLPYQRPHMASGSPSPKR